MTVIWCDLGKTTVIWVILGEPTFLFLVIFITLQYITIFAAAYKNKLAAGRQLYITI